MQLAKSEIAGKDRAGVVECILNGLQKSDPGEGDGLVCVLIASPSIVGPPPLHVDRY